MERRIKTTPMYPALPYTSKSTSEVYFHFCTCAIFSSQESLPQESSINAVLNLVNLGILGMLSRLRPYADNSEVSTSTQIPLVVDEPPFLHRYLERCCLQAGAGIHQSSTAISPRPYTRQVGQAIRCPSTCPCYIPPTAEGLAETMSSCCPGCLGVYYEVRLCWRSSEAWYT